MYIDNASSVFVVNEVFEDKLYKLYKVEKVDSCSLALRFCFEEVAFLAMYKQRFQWIEEDEETAKDYIEFLVYPMEETLTMELESNGFEVVNFHDYDIIPKPVEWSGGF